MSWPNWVVSRPRLFFAISSVSALVGGCNPHEDPKLVAETLDAEYEDVYVQAAESGTTPINVIALAKNGVVVPGVEITFSIASGAGTVTPGTTTTDSKGVATTEVSFGEDLEEIVVNAKGKGIGGSVTKITVHVMAAAPKEILIVSGDQQEGLPGAILPEFLEVQVLDEFSNPVAAVIPSFTVTQGNGEVTPMGVTDDEGKSKAIFKLGTNVPENKVTVSLSGVTPVVFTLYSLMPVQLNPAVNSASAVDLSWSVNTNPGFESYRLYRAKWGTQNFEKIQETSNALSNSYHDETGAPGQKYTYKVAVYSTLGNESFSNAQDGEPGLYIKFRYPVDMQLSANENTLYVLDGVTNRIYLVSTSTLQKTDSIQLDDNHNHSGAMALSLDQSKMYVTCPGAGSFDVVNLSTKTISQTVDISTALGTTAITDIYVAGDGQLFATSYEKYTVRMDVANNYAASRIAGNLLFFAGFTKFGDDNGQQLYLTVSNGSPNHLVKLDLTTAGIPVLLQDTPYTVFGTNEVSLSPDGQRIYTMSGQVLNSADFSQVGQLGNGGANNVSLSPDGLHVYYFNEASIETFNTDTQQLEQSLPTGVLPFLSEILSNGSSALIVTSDYLPGPHRRLYKIPLN